MLILLIEGPVINLTKIMKDDERCQQPQDVQESETGVWFGKYFVVQKRCHQRWQLKQYILLPSLHSSDLNDQIKSFSITSDLDLTAGLVIHFAADVYRPTTINTKYQNYCKYRY
jgi:hypothetical protein